jgi:DNA-binding MarR family transcriptional regulator
MRLKGASETTVSAGQVTLDGMKAKGWIERQMDANGPRYRITPAGERAWKAQISDGRSRR